MSRWGTLEGKYVFQPTPDSSSHHQIPWPRAGIFSMGAWQLEMLNLALLSRWFVSPQWELLPFGAIGVIFVFWDPCYVFFLFQSLGLWACGFKSWSDTVDVMPTSSNWKVHSLHGESATDLGGTPWTKSIQRAMAGMGHMIKTLNIHSYIYVICNSLYVEIGLESDRLTSSIV